MGTAVLVLNIVSISLGLLGASNGWHLGHKTYSGAAGTSFDWLATVLPLIGAAGSYVATWFFKGSHTELMASLTAYLLNRKDKAALRRFVQAVVDELIVAFADKPAIVKLLQELSANILPHLLATPAPSVAPPSGVLS